MPTALRTSCQQCCNEIERCEKFQTLRGPLGNITGKDNDRAVAEVPVSVGLYNAFAPVAQLEFECSKLLAL
jgi:hypothetical protein